MTAEIIQFNLPPEYIREARKIIKDMQESDLENFTKSVIACLLQEVSEGIEGGSESQFFKMVDALYDEVSPHGCYFCDTSIDVNAVDFTDDTVVCWSCQKKLKKLMAHVDKVKNNGYISG